MMGDLTTRSGLLCLLDAVGIGGIVVAVRGGECSAQCTDLVEWS